MKVAIVGATGLVGQTLIKILEERDFVSKNEIYLYASEKSVGKIVKIAHKKYKIISLEYIKAVDFAFFCSSITTTRQFAHKFMQKGAVIIDNSGAYNKKPKIPLVIPEINFEKISANTKIIANPNCCTIALALSIFAIAKKKQIKRIVVSTYQAASDAGADSNFNLSYNPDSDCKHKITENIIPQIGNFLANGDTCEENSIHTELNKILDSKIAVSATCVHIPIAKCHSASVSVEFFKNTSVQFVKNMLSMQDGVTVVDSIKHSVYPMPIFAKKTDNVLVGRIRKDPSHKKCINMFLCIDNLRKGAALNAVQIMEIMTS